MKKHEEIPLWKYHYGAYSDVIRRTGSMLSSIESPDVRKAVLKKGNVVCPFVIGIFQEDSVLGKNRSLAQELELCTQRVIHHSYHAEDQYHLELICLLYDEERMDLEQVQKALPHDPLKRILLQGQYLPPHFRTKNFLENDIHLNCQLAGGSVSSTELKTLQTSRELLMRMQEQYGLTRIEAIHLYALKQGLARIDSPDKQQPPLKELAMFFSLLQAKYILVS